MITYKEFKYRINDAIVGCDRLSHCFKEVGYLLKEDEKNELQELLKLLDRDLEFIKLDGRDFNTWSKEIIRRVIKTLDRIGKIVDDKFLDDLEWENYHYEYSIFKNEPYNVWHHVNQFWNEVH